MIKRLRRAAQIQVFVILVLGAVLGSWEVEKTGDRLQMALPIAGLACAIANREAINYLVRFTSTIGVVHAIKRGLGDAEINQRPSGGLRGFPSGHTAAAVFGASYLVNDCLQRNKIMQGLAIFGGAFVGASRIEAGKHFLFQVMVGALFGWLGERGFAVFQSIKFKSQRYWSYCSRGRRPARI